MVSRYAPTGYLGVNAAPPQSGHPGQHQSVPINVAAMATLNQQSHGQQQSQQQQSQQQIKAQNHEYHMPQVMGQIPPQQQQIHAPSGSSAPHYIRVQQQSQTATVYQQNPGQIQQQSAGSGQQQQIATTMRGMPPAPSTPPQQDVLNKMSQPNQYHIQQMPLQQGVQSAAPQARNGPYRPQNMTNTRRINPQQQPQQIYYNYPNFVAMTPQHVSILLFSSYFLFLLFCD
jgi:hypothetical protein